MIYDIRHITTYSYDAPVTSARCAVSLTPADGGGQRVLAHRVELTPDAATRAERSSFFGHRVVAARIDVPHRELRVEARSRVAVSREPPSAARRPWEHVRDEALTERGLGPASPVHYLGPSRLVPLLDAAASYAAASFRPCRDVLEAAHELATRIKAEFRFDPEATQVSTPVAEAFEARHGVCQDFAQVMLAGLRGLGLPASYVSGYIRTLPPPGQPRLEGADATHAWVRVWCGREAGWIGIDPTNGVLVAGDHITLAFGRDYADVSPIDGVILGAGSQRLRTAVDVVPAE